ncbi:MAG: hypothetical protein ACM34K_20350 [Bacillota bacterium]
MLKKIITGLLFLNVLCFAQKSPHGSQLNLDCSNCHQASSWKVSAKQIEFNHSSTGFELTGKHRAADCRACHKDLVFNNVSTQCSQCHFEPHQNTLEKDCQRCHTTNSWKSVNMADIHNQFRFTLVGVHAINDCKMCHDNAENFIYSGVSTDCYSCHKKDYQNTVNPAHAVMALSTNCQDCHTLQSREWKAERFVHTAISLKGPHKDLRCNQCHTSSHVTQLCYDCHKKDYDLVTDPSHINGNFPHDCLLCHSSDTWTGARFDHSATGFPLTGVHQTTSCSKCHTSSYKGTPTQCQACHQDSYNQAANPNHLSAGISKDCQICHNTSAWIPSNFNHSVTGFTLIGAHLKIQQCSSCHNGTTSGQTADCFSCHQRDYNRAENHLVQNYPKNCNQCHNMNSWDGAKFDHASTTFPLTGAHRTASCLQCHTSAYKGTPADCYSCHKNNFNNAASPNHTSAGISTDCQKCHSTAAWKPSGFSHTSTGFQLTGAHSSLQCSSCHKGTTAGLKADCFICHEADYNKAVNHLSQAFPHNCEQCHSTSAWTGAIFNHSATNFPLTGAHLTTSCSKCHTSSYKGTPTQCQSCHQESFSQAINPNHAAAGISKDCQTCHSTTAWIPSGFNHSSTGFSLTGAHLRIQQCSTCHKGTTSGLAGDCFSCHQADYNRAENHIAQNYPKNCDQCHNMNNWDNARFDHSSTSFPLTGAHTTVLCSSCHSSTYKGTSTICNDCHKSNYNNSVNPKHTALSLATVCTTCHTTNQGWKPAQFPEHNKYYLLDGAHALKASDCYGCHKGNYNNTPNTCYGCHQTNYNNSSNPSHLSLGFSQDCMSCHNKNAWRPASFKNHDGQFFPIYSGSHRGRWSLCSDCHSVANSYKIFECINCHEHSQTNTDQHHRGVKGYVYKSTECYRCHPQGRSEAFQQTLSY